MRLIFGPFTLDADARQLTREGKPLHLSPKAFQLLCLLVRSRPIVLDRIALRQQLWPDTHVVEASLSNLIAEIRGVLAGESFLRTVHGVGYAFSGEVREEGNATKTGGPESPRFWLVWNDRAIAVSGLEAVVGRDPTSDVWIDAPGVSRRHARIRIDERDGEARAFVEDLKSTNGTYIGGVRVDRLSALKDGDTLRLGEASLEFRSRKRIDAPTKRVRPPRA